MDAVGITCPEFSSGDPMVACACNQNYLGKPALEWDPVEGKWTGLCLPQYNTDVDIGGAYTAPSGSIEECTTGADSMTTDVSACSGVKCAAGYAVVDVTLAACGDCATIGVGAAPGADVVIGGCQIIVILVYTL